MRRDASLETHGTHRGVLTFTTRCRRTIIAGILTVSDALSYSVKGMRCWYMTRTCTTSSMFVLTTACSLCLGFI